MTKKNIVAASFYFLLLVPTVTWCVEYQITDATDVSITYNLRCVNREWMMTDASGLPLQVGHILFNLEENIVYIRHEYDQNATTYRIIPEESDEDIIRSLLLPEE